ncbi:MAG: helix-turn-helix transcriptional regulator [Clostridia bacterium]|nr:helix-turn-helix transcriptional regulator [Clostridia bacterium]
MPNIVREALSPLAVTLTDPKTFNPAELPEEVREEIIREHMHQYKLRNKHGDLFFIWQEETAISDRLCDQILRTKSETERKRLMKDYFKSSVVLCEIEKKMAEQNIPVPHKKRRFEDILASAPTWTARTAVDESDAADNMHTEHGETAGENRQETVDKMALLQWLDEFDPTSLTLEERWDMRSGMPDVQDEGKKREILCKEYGRERESLKKSLLRGLSFETCMLHLSHALHYKISLSLIELRLSFKPTVFGSQLKAVRTAAGDDVGSLASKLGRTPQTIMKWENGETGKTEKTGVYEADLWKIGYIYGVSVEYLFGLDGTQEIRHGQAG